MSRVQRIRRRRAGDSTAGHRRARDLAAERLDGPLQPGDGAWLDEHLAGCDTCRTVAVAYEADQAALRGLRDLGPEPPRDLWARTSAAIEREAASRRTWPRPALGVLSGVAVVVVVIGASVLSGGFVDGPKTAIAPAASTPPVAIASSAATPGPTPITVGAGAVGWIGTSADGALAYNVTDVQTVCPPERQPDCAPVSDGNSRRVDLAIRPKSISQSPIQNQAVVVGTDAAGGDAVLVVSLPTAAPTATATSSPAATPSLEPTATATSTSTVVPASPGETPESTPSSEPTPTPMPSAMPTPTLTPTPSVAVTLAIVSGVKVVGQSAAYSPDGAWFAFTARPSDDSAGPDIYVWRVGDPLARPMTQDHVSVFASWIGSRMLGSRPATPATTAVPEVPAQSFVLDPSTGKETPIADAVWRPVADPSGRWAALWDGSVRVAPDGLTSVPAIGSLVLRAFTAKGIMPSASPDPADVAAVVTDGPVADYDVRWDETGTWLAVWLADATDPAIGRLSLVRFDPASGRLERPHGAPQDVTALPGFSIANGRLAWATPRGQGGEGSRVQIVAWTKEAVGAVESGPVEDVVVIH
jgi:hypothetical protein